MTDPIPAREGLTAAEADRADALLTMLAGEGELGGYEFGDGPVAPEGRGRVRRWWWRYELPLLRRAVAQAREVEVAKQAAAAPSAGALRKALLVKRYRKALEVIARNEKEVDDEDDEFESRTCLVSMDAEELADVARGALASLWTQEEIATLSRTESPLTGPVSAGAENVAGMRLVIQACQKQFEEYARQHRAKGTPEADLKAVTNDHYASLCFKALRPAEPGRSEAPASPGEGLRGTSNASMGDLRALNALSAQERAPDTAGGGE